MSKLDRIKNKHIILILSGGADSATLLYHHLANGCRVDCVTFYYGQKHRKEILAAESIAAMVGAKIDRIDLFGFSEAVASSLLFGGEDIPHGHYEEDQMKRTVVPNRNMVMISVAASIAISRNAYAISIGAHSGDHAIYPDCRDQFMTHAETAIWSGNWGVRPRVIAPFIDMDKGEIIKLGKSLGVPYELTWTCYEGQHEPCGKCGACVERNEAFKVAA